MFINNWKHEILTIPNILSMIRLLMIPIYTDIYLNASKQEDYILAGCILALSCITDGLDGYIARRFHMCTILGKILDPLADKLTQLTLTFCLCHQYPAMIPVMALLILKETLQLIGTIILINRGVCLPGPMPAGKLCTGVFFTSLIVLVLFSGIPNIIIFIIAGADALLLLLAFFSYYSLFAAYPHKNTDQKNDNNPC